MQHKNLAPQDSHSPSQERIENNSGVAIPPLKCVRYTQVGTLYPEVVISGVNDDVRGITQSIVQNASSGYILCYGFMYNVDTSAWPTGTSLFCDANGDLTDVSGGGPQVANVLKQHATQGVIGVTCLDTPAALQVTVQDTDSIEMDTVGNIINSDLRLSATAATANREKAIATIKSSPSPGLHVEYPWAATAQNGILTATDWNIFFNRVQQGDPRLSVMNVLKVKKNPGTGEFLTIAAAIAAANAGTPSATNRYVIHIAPGVYTEAALVVPAYVYLVGYEIDSVIIEPNANSHDVITLSDNTSLNFVTVRNAGTGFAAVLALDTGDNTILHKVDIETSDCGVCARTSVGATGTHYVYLEYVSVSGAVERAIKAENLGAANIRMQTENLFVSADGTDTPVGIELGSMVDLVLSSGTLERTGAAFGDAILLTSDAEADIASVHVDNWDNAFHITDNAAAKVNAATFENNNLNINVDSATASGYLAGYSEYEKVQIDPASSFFITNKDANIISVAVKGGDFTSVKDAVDSITGASAVNPYKVSVGPGVFVEDPIVMKPFVVVEGADDSVTVIKANDPTQPLITGANNSELKQVLLQGPTNAGVPLVRYVGTANTSSPFGTIECAFEDTDLIYQLVSGPTFPAVLRSEGCRISSASTLVNRIAEVDGTDAAAVLLFIDGFTYRRMTSPQSGLLFDVTGPQARLLLNNSLFETNGTSTDGLEVSDGSRIGLFSVVMQGMDSSVHALNTGAAPDIQASNLVIRNSTVDIAIDHPGTTGNISGIANSNKITVDPASPFTITLTSNLLDGGMLASGPLKIGRKFSYAENVLDLLEGEPSMGVMDGGDLTDGGAFQVNVSEGFGYAMVSNFPDHRIRRIEWNNTSITLGANQDVYVYYNNAGTLTSSASVSNTAVVVLLGRVVTNGTGIELIDQSPLHTHHPVNHLDQLFRDALGPIYDSGSIVTEGSTPFELDVTSGVYFFSVNRFTPVGGTNINFTQYYQNGLGGWNRSTQSLVNDTSWDDGTGSLAPLTPGYYTKHALYVSGDGAAEKYFLVLGQAEYAALAPVEDAPLPALPPWIKDSVTPIAAIVVQEGAANITEVLDIRPRIGFTASGVSASADHGNLLGLADDDHQQYLLVDGSRPMAGDLDMGGNDVTNVGLVDGVDVSAHAARHLPNGADPLTTAAPLTAVGGNTANATGTANSMARSDHQHAVATGVPSTITPDQSNAAGSSNNLARADHIHNIPADVAVGLNANSTNTEGTDPAFARADHTHDLATGVVSSQTPDQSNAEGASANLARADHTHNIATAAPVTVNADGSNNQGVSTSFSRADHKHDIATAAPVTQNPDQSNSAGVSTSLARADHVHNIPADAPTTTLSPATTNAEGVGTSFARNDHTHAIATGVVGNIVTIVPDASASAGVQNNFARTDHAHAIVTDAPSSNLTASTTNAEGASTSFSRADHSHAISTGTPVTQNPDQANAAGVSVNLARADHVHNIPADTAVALNTSSTSTEGASSSFARADHTHAVTIVDGEATGTGTTTTTSGTQVLMSGMTLTPAAGRYMVWFSTSLQSSSAGQTVICSIFSGGVQVAHTQRRAIPRFDASGGLGGNANTISQHPMATHCIVTVNGAQAIEGRWQTSGGTATAFERTLNIVKLSN